MQWLLTDGLSSEGICASALSTDVNKRNLMILFKGYEVYDYEMLPRRLLDTVHETAMASIAVSRAHDRQHST